MKVSVAHVVNGRVAGKSDLVSLLAGNQNGNFASLLDLSGTSPDAPQTLDDTAGRHRSQRKDEDDGQGQPTTPRKSMLSEAFALSEQTAPSIAIAPWHVESDRSSNAADATTLICSSLPSGPISDPVVAIHSRPFAANEQTAHAPVMVLSQLPYNGASTLSPMEDDSVELSEGPRGPDIEIKTVAPPNDSGIQSIRASSGVADSGTVRTAAGLNASITSPIAHSDSNPASVSISTAGSAAPSHVMRSADGRDNPSGSPKDGATDCSTKDGGQSLLSAPTRAEDAASSFSTVASGWNLNGASEIHRGGDRADETIADTTLSISPKSRVENMGGLGPNTLLQEHPALLASDHSGSIRDVEPNAQPQLSEPTLARSADESAARLINSAMQGDLRVGVRTEAFGHVTIQANAQGGQLSAQLSVENAKESAVLAAHLPVAEHRLTQQHGLTASVRLASGFAGKAGGFMGRGQSGSDRRDSGPHVAMRSGQMEQGLSGEDRGVEASVIVSRHFVTSRLDVTV